MNGRMFDPTVGRFLSADPFVKAPDFSQSLNRYSYVWNNPLSFTDPSGFETEGGAPFRFGFGYGWVSVQSIRYPASVSCAGIEGATPEINPVGGSASGLPAVQVQVIGLCEDGGGDLCDLTELEASSSDVNFAELGRAVGERWDYYWSEEFGGDVSVALTVTGVGGTVRVAVVRLTPEQWRNGLQATVLAAARLLNETGMRIPQAPRPTLPQPPAATQPYVPPVVTLPRVGGT